MTEIKPFSQACINNREPIAAILERVFRDRRQVLEIGSGTGQHAIFFAPRLRHLSWQPSDRAENLPGIRAWLDEYPADNLHQPIELDVDRAWPQARYDAFFTANTCHIMAWPSVTNVFAGIARVASPSATLAIYGPFKYGGRFTSESNARFDAWLKSQVRHQGVRDIEDIVALASGIGFELLEDHAMPANNQLLVFGRGEKPLSSTPSTEAVQATGQ